MKLGQLIEHNMRNIFLKKYFRKCGEETIPRKFKIEYILDQQSKILYSFFSVYGKLRVIKIY